MIPKYRNRALIEIACALGLTVLCVLLTRKVMHTAISQRSGGWTALVVIAYFATWVMWMVASLSLTRAKGYQRDFTSGLFVFIYIIGFCFPIAPVLFPLFIILALEDKTKGRMRRH
jgi:hypothetical protein